MLNEVKQLGLEKFAGDEELADQFVAGFVAHVMLEKEAQDLELEKVAAPQKPMDLTREMAEGMAGQAGRAVGGFAVNSLVAGATILGRSVSDQFRYQRFKKALLQALQSSHILQSAPRNKVEMYADTIYKFAPMVATDPNLLQSVLTNAVHGDGVDIMTVKSLTDLENKWRENGSVNPKAFV